MGIMLDFKTQQAFNRAIGLCELHLDEDAYQVSGFKILFEDEADARRLFPEIFEPKKYRDNKGLVWFGWGLLVLLAIAGGLWVFVKIWMRLF